MLLRWLARAYLRLAKRLFCIIEGRVDVIDHAGMMVDGGLYDVYYVIEGRVIKAIGLKHQLQDGSRGTLPGDPS